MISGGHYTVLSKGLCHIFKNDAFANAYGGLFTLLSISSKQKSEKKINWYFKRQFYYTKKCDVRSKGTCGNIPNRIDSKKTDEISKEDILRMYHQQVDSFSCIVQCTKETACELFIKFPFLKTTGMAIFQPKFTLLLEEGVAKEELMNDMWIFTYSLQKLKDKLQLVKSMHFTPVKPWQLRCSEDVLYKLSQNKENNRQAMSPYQTLTDYICERLQLTESQVHTFASKHPPVMRVKVAKLKEVMDYLFSEGFTPSQIYYTPRILCHSLKTIQKRLAVLRAHNVEPHSLFILCKSQRRFDDFVKNLKTEN